MKNLFNLQDKVVIITGGSTGLGMDAAKEFAELGAIVAIFARNEVQMNEVASPLLAQGLKVETVVCDVTKEDEVKRGVEYLANKYGKIDVLINNAGVAVRGGVDTLSEEDWNLSMDVNVKGIYLMSKYVVPHMKARNYGKIINIASVNAIVADKSDVFIRHSYNASKAAVVGLTKGMACSYAQYGITVNAVGPGLFESGMTKDTLFKSEEFLKGYNYTNPTGRPGNKYELNGALIFFATDASSYVNGQFLIVDGGTTQV